MGLATAPQPATMSMSTLTAGDNDDNLTTIREWQVLTSEIYSLEGDQQMAMKTWLLYQRAEQQKKNTKNAELVEEEEEDFSMDDLWDSDGDDEPGPAGGSAGGRDDWRGGGATSSLMIAV